MSDDCINICSSSDDDDGVQIMNVDMLNEDVKENRGLEKLSKKLVVPLRVDDEKDIFNNFLEKCRTTSPDDVDIEKGIEKLKKRFNDTEKNYLSSIDFRKLIESAISRLVKEPWTQMKRVADELGHNKVIVKVKCVPTEEVNDEPSSPSLDLKTKRHIKKLEKLLKKIKAIITGLEEEELNLDDLDDDNSSYIKVSRYKERFNEVYKKICELRKRQETLSETEKPLRFSSTKIPTVDRAIEKYYNDTRKFPDYRDILKVVEAVNIRKHLNLPSHQVERLAETAFRELGETLQRRRQYDLFNHFGYYMDDEDTGPPSDDELQEKLKQNKKIFEKKLNELIDVHASKQTENSCEPIEIPDDVASSDENEDDKDEGNEEDCVTSASDYELEEDDNMANDDERTQHIPKPHNDDKPKPSEELTKPLQIVLTDLKELKHLLDGIKLSKKDQRILRPTKQSKFEDFRTFEDPSCSKILLKNDMPKSTVKDKVASKKRDDPISKNKQEHPDDETEKVVSKKPVHFEDNHKGKHSEKKNEQMALKKLDGAANKNKRESDDTEKVSSKKTNDLLDCYKRKLAEEKNEKILSKKRFNVLNNNKREHSVDEKEKMPSKKLKPSLKSGLDFDVKSLVHTTPLAAAKTDTTCLTPGFKIPRIPKDSSSKVTNAVDDCELNLALTNAEKVTEDSETFLIESNVSVNEEIDERKPSSYILNEKLRQQIEIENRIKEERRYFEAREKSYRVALDEGKVSNVCRENAGDVIEDEPQNSILPAEKRLDEPEKEPPVMIGENLRLDCIKPTTRKLSLMNDNNFQKKMDIECAAAQLATSINDISVSIVEELGAKEELSDRSLPVIEDQDLVQDSIEKIYEETVMKEIFCIDVTEDEKSADCDTSHQNQVPDLCSISPTKRNELSKSPSVNTCNPNCNSSLIVNTSNQILSASLEVNLSESETHSIAPVNTLESIPKSDHQVNDSKFAAEESSHAVKSSKNPENFTVVNDVVIIDDSPVINAHTPNKIPNEIVEVRSRKIETNDKDRHFDLGTFIRKMNFKPESNSSPRIKCPSTTTLSRFVPPAPRISNLVPPAPKISGSFAPRFTSTPLNRGAMMNYFRSRTPNTVSRSPHNSSLYNSVRQMTFQSRGRFGSSLNMTSRLPTSNFSLRNNQRFSVNSIAQNTVRYPMNDHSVRHTSKRSQLSIAQQANGIIAQRRTVIIEESLTGFSAMNNFNRIIDERPYSTPRSMSAVTVTQANRQRARSLNHKSDEVITLD